MDEIASLLRELIASTDETNRLLNEELNLSQLASLGESLLERLDGIKSDTEELNWLNELSLGQVLLARLDRIESILSSIQIG
jgi:hypothetical protein